MEMMSERKDRKPKKVGPKKSETLEVRLDHQTKQDFIETCRENGTTASDVVRGGIDRYLAKQRKSSRRPTPEANDGVSAMIVPFVKERKRVLAGGVGAATLAALVALPSAAGPDVRAAFDRLDRNGDGVLSAEEYMPSTEDGEKTTQVIRIERMDDAEAADHAAESEKDVAFAYWIPSDDAESDESGVTRSHEIRIVRREAGDGVPIVDSPEELGALYRKVRAESFAAIDYNGDGQVSFDEYERHNRELLEAGFERLDADGDGFLTKAEYTAAPMVAISAVRTETVETGGEKRIELRVGDGDHELPDRGAAFDKLDGNGDGRLSLQEYMPAT